MTAKDEHWPDAYFQPSDANIDVQVAVAGSEIRPRRACVALTLSVCLLGLERLN